MVFAPWNGGHDFEAGQGLAEPIVVKSSVDDGSTDATVEVARAAGADHIECNKSNMGLARTFSSGLHACLERDANIIVNTDGDNHYSGASIPDLVRPNLEGRADIVVGDRGTQEVAHFSMLKKLL